MDVVFSGGGATEDPELNTFRCGARRPAGVITLLFEHRRLMQGWLRRK
jgi:hypothetical protein